jgi:hypothetical protein
MRNLAAKLARGCMAGVQGPGAGVVPSLQPGDRMRAHRRRDRPDICSKNQWDVTLFERANVQ